MLTLIWAVSLGMFAQNITVKGTVSDANQEPLIGVTVRVLNSTIGTITDFDGNYTLSDVTPSATLEFSYVGMVTQTISLNGRTNLNVTLTEDRELLDEVVVVGYGTQSKRRVTTAVKMLMLKTLCVHLQQLRGALIGKVPEFQQEP